MHQSTCCTLLTGEPRPLPPRQTADYSYYVIPGLGSGSETSYRAPVTVFQSGEKFSRSISFSTSPIHVCSTSSFFFEIHTQSCLSWTDAGPGINWRDLGVNLGV